MKTDSELPDAENPHYKALSEIFAALSDPKTSASRYSLGANAEPCRKTECAGEPKTAV